jgi:carboxymethylenebutenolidase
VLVQVGLLEPEGLPVAGIATARKAVDQSLPSNELMTKWASSASKPI